jgi:hypothetical protein
MMIEIEMSLLEDLQKRKHWQHAAEGTLPAVSASNLPPTGADVTEETPAINGLSQLLGEKQKMTMQGLWLPRTLPLQSRSGEVRIPPITLGNRLHPYLARLLNLAKQCRV